MPVTVRSEAQAPRGLKQESSRLCLLAACTSAPFVNLPGNGPEITRGNPGSGPQRSYGSEGPSVCGPRTALGTGMKGFSRQVRQSWGDSACWVSFQNLSLLYSDSYPSISTSFFFLVLFIFGLITLCRSFAGKREKGNWLGVKRKAGLILLFKSCRRLWQKPVKNFQRAFLWNSEQSSEVVRPAGGASAAEI